MCPLEKTIGMMRAIVTYYEGARKAIVESSSETKINWNDIHFQTKPLFTELTQMKFMVIIINQQINSKRLTFSIFYHFF